MMSQPASRLHQRLLHQHLDGLVIEDHAVAQQPVMAVAGVGIERDVAQDADVRHFLLDRADGAADEIVGIERLAAVLVAQARIGIGKERDAGDRELRRALGLAHGLIDRKPLHARHRGDRHARAFCPSTTNIGQIRSAADSVFSRTMRRSHSVAAQAARAVRSDRAAARAAPRPARSGLALERTAELDRHDNSPSDRAVLAGFRLRHGDGPLRLVKRSSGPGADQAHRSITC